MNALFNIDPQLWGENSQQTYPAVFIHDGQASFCHYAEAVVVLETPMARFHSQSDAINTFRLNNWLVVPCVSDAGTQGHVALSPKFYHIQKR